MLKFKQKKALFCIYLVIFTLAGILTLPQNSTAQDENYPKLANYYIAWDISDQEIYELAKWDVVILSPQAIERHPETLNKLRQKNPQIIILAYSLTLDINITVINESPLYQKIYNKVNQNNWWLKSTDGQPLSWWPDSWMINISSVASKTNGQNYADFLPELVYQEFLNDGKWDGVFFDNFWHSVSFLRKPIDINGDNIADSPEYLDAKWVEGFEQIVNKTRQLAPNKIIVANTTSNTYNQYLNGRMLENFPAGNEGYWSGTVNNYINHNLGYNPKYFIINTTTNNTGLKNDYKNFRFGLTSTLLGDGYYSFDYGDQAHESLWWYDEYNLFLGRPVSDVKNLLDNSSKEIKPGVWQRDFQNALVLVNSTNQQQKVSFDEEFEKIRGSQDTKTNNGAIVRTVTLAPNDGLILLRRVEDVTNTPYFNGSFVRVFDKKGEVVRNGFFIYDKQFRGGQVVLKKDINKDGQLEIIVANHNQITIYNHYMAVLKNFYPYGQDYNKGINLAVNDFENDGYYELITGTMKGYAPIIKIFNYQGETINEGFYAYTKTYMGGVTLAVCDTNGNKKKEIVTGTGFMGGPQVRAFDKDGKLLSGGFFAYSPDFRGGVNVACGDIDGNGIDEIVTGAGYGGSTHVRIFNSKFEPLDPGFWAFSKDSRTGVRIFINDLDDDGKAEILAAAPDTFTTAINQFYQ